MGFYIVFTLLMIICVFTIIFSLKQKHKNIGFLFTTICIVVIDVLCLFILAADTIKEARNFLILYYLFYPWLFFGSLWTIDSSYSTKKHYDCGLIMSLICGVQTIIVGFSYMKNGLIIFSREILFGRIWWIAEFPKNVKISAFKIYFALVLLCALIILGTLAYFIKSVPKVFKPKYITLGIIQFFVLCLVIPTFVYKMPVWIHTIVINFVAYITFYYVFLYSDIKLRDTVLYDFANEMSDGLAVYNKYNDLIFVNHLIKLSVSDAYLAALEDINRLEAFISRTETIEGIEVVPYGDEKYKLYFKVRKTVIGNGNAFIGTVYTFHDTTSTITQIKNMEEVNIELERTAKMKADFLANMSHELRTPMNAVIGLAEIALREQAIPSNVRDCLNQINSSGRNLLNIINDILDFSKIDSGKMEIIPEKYEPLSEVNDISHILQTRVGDKHLEFFFIADPKLPHELYGDCMRIRQIIINLANNAIKFTEHGMVKIDLKCHFEGDDTVILEYHILDTGHGIKEEDLKKLFVSFQQVDTKRNRSVEGTGLGLAISKKLVEAMGGTIGVQSEYGKGSDFWFKIPQKIVNKTSDLVVDDAENKYAYCLNENLVLQDEFSLEMKSLGLDGRVISSLKMYEPTGKHDFVMFMYDFYGDELKAFLDSHPDVIGVVLCAYDSTFKSDRKNLRVLKKPLSTLAMVLALNGKTIDQMAFKTKEAKFVNFTAPDAKVLIVDDNAINLSIAVGLLEPMKVQCSVAQSGAEAIEKIKEEEFDIILMDHMMPEMDGVETTQKIRQTIPEADFTPIIALTANVLEGSKEIFLKAGMVDMIAKPIDINQLNAKMIKWLPNFKIHEEAPKTEEELMAEEADTREEELFDCLDCEKAIKGLGTVNLFKKVVEDYYKAGRDNLAAIQKALAASDYANYAIKTHSLKSTSRQIGAMDLGSLAEKLEHAGKASDEAEIRKYHDQAMEMYDKLLTDLSKYFESAADSADKPEITADQLEEIFKALYTACDDLDMDGMLACGEDLEKYSYPAGKDEIIQKLLSAINGIDPDTCMELMEEYRK